MAPPRSASDPFAAVSDPTRRAILDLLHAAGGEAPFAAIAARFPTSGPAVSRHLRVLRDARLVRERRGNDDRRERVYQLDPAPLREVARWAAVYEPYWKENLAALKARAELVHAQRTGGTTRVRARPHPIPRDDDADSATR